MTSLHKIAAFLGKYFFAKNTLYKNELIQTFLSLEKINKQKNLKKLHSIPTFSEQVKPSTCQGNIFDVIKILHCYMP